MRRKTKKAYKELFSFLKSLLPNKRMASISTDFEKAIADTAEEIFEGIVKKKCFFHFTQVISGILLTAIF